MAALRGARWTDNFPDDCLWQSSTPHDVIIMKFRFGQRGGGGMLFIDEEQKKGPASTPTHHHLRRRR